MSMMMVQTTTRITTAFMEDFEGEDVFTSESSEFIPEYAIFLALDTGSVVVVETFLWTFLQDNANDCFGTRDNQTISGVTFLECVANEIVARSIDPSMGFRKTDPKSFLLPSQVNELNLIFNTAEEHIALFFALSLISLSVSVNAPSA